MPIERANAADRAAARLAQVVGPLLAGSLIALLGSANVLFVDAATFVASAAVVAVGVPFAVSARVEAEATGRRGTCRSCSTAYGLSAGTHWSCRSSWWRR
jgi:hypothetical protein